MLSSAVAHDSTPKQNAFGVSRPYHSLCQTVRSTYEYYYTWVNQQGQTITGNYRSSAHSDVSDMINGENDNVMLEFMLSAKSSLRVALIFQTRVTYAFSS